VREWIAGTNLGEGWERKGKGQRKEKGMVELNRRGKVQKMAMK
jgi:hypothetical protein